MAIGIRLKFEGLDAATFDKANALVDAPNNPPDGCIFHSSGPIDGGYGVIDFWESREHFDRFAQEKIGPIMGQLGIEGRPDVKEFPVHEYFKP
jgi:hypothetical protein